MRKVRLFKSESDGLWYFSVVGDNGQIVAQSEGYARRDDALDTVEKYYVDWSIVDNDGKEISR